MSGITVINEVAEAHYGGGDVPEFVTHPETGETVARMEWHSTDAWRGFYDAIPADGWKKVGEGANCGDWEDTPPGTSNDEVRQQIDKLAEQYGDVVVVLGGSSNVFSLTFDVLAREDEVVACPGCGSTEPDCEEDCPVRQETRAEDEATMREAV